MAGLRARQEGKKLACNKHLAHPVSQTALTPVACQEWFLVHHFFSVSEREVSLQVQEPKTVWEDQVTTVPKTVEEDQIINVPVPRAIQVQSLLQDTVCTRTRDFEETCSAYCDFHGNPRPIHQQQHKRTHHLHQHKHTNTQDPVLCMGLG